MQVDAKHHLERSHRFQEKPAARLKLEEARSTHIPTSVFPELARGNPSLHGF
jgi:hypothetical protein